MAGQREATWGSSLGLVEKIQLLGNSFQLNETGTNEKRGAKLIPPPPPTPLFPPYSLPLSRRNLWRNEGIKFRQRKPALKRQKTVWALSRED